MSLLEWRSITMRMGANTLFFKGRSFVRSCSNLCLSTSAQLPGALPLVVEKNQKDGIGYVKFVNLEHVSTV